MIYIVHSFSQPSLSVCTHLSLTSLFLYLHFPIPATTTVMPFSLPSTHLHCYSILILRVWKLVRSIFFNLNSNCLWDWANLGLNLFIRFIWALLVRFWVWPFWFGFEFGSFLFIGLKHAFGFFICTIALFFCFCTSWLTETARLTWGWLDGNRKKTLRCFHDAFLLWFYFAIYFGEDA